MMRKRMWLLLLFSMAVIAIGLITHVRRYIPLKTGQESIDIKFEIIKESFSRNDALGARWDAEILISPQDYTEGNLYRLFSWYSQKHASKNRTMVEIYTDKNNIPPADESDWYSNRYRHDAILIKELNWSSRISEKNEWYSYYPDLSNRRQTKTVLLNGGGHNPTESAEDNWDTSFGELSIRIHSYEQNDVDPSGIYHNFLYKLPGFDDWKELFTVWQNERHNDPSRYIRHISDQFTYVFMERMYAATLDGGKTWFGWNAREKMSNWQCCDPNYIQGVQITPDGYGTMYLNTHKPLDANASILHTKDFGKSWSQN